MSYVNAEDVLPKMLVEEIQKYVDGQLLYIPRKNGRSLSWGEKNGTKEKMNVHYHGEKKTAQEKNWQNVIKR